MAESLKSLTDALDHHLVRRGEVRHRDQELTKLIEQDLAALREKLLNSGTTGLPLQDWALLAYGDKYQEFMKAAMQVGVYLLRAVSEPAPSLVAIYGEFSPNNSSINYTIHIGVLEGEGMRLAQAGRGLQVQVPCSVIYREEGVIRDGSSRPQKSETYHGFIVIDGLISPDLSLNTAGRYFSSQTETTPYLTSRLQAGTDAVRAYLREFWKEHELREATEFFRSIMSQATEARP